MPHSPSRREAIGLIAGLPLLAGAGAGAAVAAAPSLAAATVRERIGVCVHLNDTASAYHDWPRVAACLRHIGLRHLRTAAPQRDTLGYMLTEKAAAAGYRLTFTMRHNRPFAAEIADLEAFARSHRGAIAAIEGPNEIDHSPVTFDGPADSKADALAIPTAALGYQAALADAIRGSDALRGIPLIAFSDFAQARQRATLSNTHIYPRNGATLGSRLAGMHRRLDPVGRPIVISETGFHTLPAAKPFPGTDEAIQALLIGEAVEAAAGDPGVTRTFLYELLDSYPPDGAMETHFGLFRYDYGAKRSAAVVRRLTLG